MRAQSAGSERHLDRRRLGLRHDADAADIVLAFDHPFGQAETGDEVLQVERRRHHHGIGQRPVADIDRPFDRDLGIARQHGLVGIAPARARDRLAGGSGMEHSRHHASAPFASGSAKASQ
jgi:hypothetical protein